MKHIVFIKEVLTQEDIETLTEELNQTRALFSISIATSSVTIEGSNDILHHAKQAIQNAGFTIQ